VHDLRIILVWIISSKGLDENLRWIVTKLNFVCMCSYSHSVSSLSLNEALWNFLTIIQYSSWFMRFEQEVNMPGASVSFLGYQTTPWRTYKKTKGDGAATLFIHFPIYTLCVQCTAMHTNGRRVLCAPEFSLSNSVYIKVYMSP